MSDFNIKPYNSSDKIIWDDFASKSNQDTFLFQRDFIDYHSERFQDFSLMIYKGDKLIALLPANVKDKILYSHQGLSYGGLIIWSQTRFNDYVNIVQAVLKYIDSKSIEQFFIKALPSIYNELISEEWNYIANSLDVKIETTDSYFIIDNSKDYAPNRNRRRALKNAESQSIEIVDDDIDFFWEYILSKNLKNKFGIKPVHTIEEIKLLINRFPNNIKFYATKINDTLTAGVVLFETKHVAHFQYSSGNEECSETGSLDVLFHHIIEKYQNKKYISFGSSSTDKSLKVSKGLMYWKESFGARLITQNTYAINPCNRDNLKAIFND
ncbi:GNAT family N-acetyltransferase [Winogradskyella sp. PG-2]|uniref:GNAT family N-acetyltransferase n=1 Tax=Winogradskyella sp. PG-2 TaxID=754409 RepID=UPI00045885A3|nr:GNAT family N-acetyltransferase [Winogradskyella sp. PG-2]BAO76631.1 hypothetical protein WPG_2401 [Winogradskyella sp. PG-2]